MNSKFLNRSIQLLVVLCTLSLILGGCSSPPTIASSNLPAPSSTNATYWPTEAWRTSLPEEQGMDPQKLAEMLAAIQAEKLDLHSLLIIRNGYLVSESYFGPYQEDTRHEIYSVTKSFVATLIGIALDQGYIDEIDQRVLDFFSDEAYANLDQQKEGMTLQDVLTMRAGLDWQEGNAAYGAMYSSPDWVKFMLDKPMALPAGGQFNYCSGCSHLLSAIIQQATGMNTYDFAEQTLFKPLGISNVEWDRDATGIPIGGWGLQITPRDMAKLGYLYLQNGQWDGEQIVSAEWAENATQTHTGTDSELGYGYQWWTYSSLEAYTALGLYGQTIFVIPASDLVIVTTAEMENHDEIFRLIEEYILPAVQKSP